MATKNSDPAANGWTGWVAFAALMLIIVGFFHLFAGIVALFNSDVYLIAKNSTWLVSYTSWGWAHIVWGVLSILAGGSLAKGNMYGRIVAVVVALMSAVVNLAFVPVYPIWSILIIVVDICVIFAVTVHGKDMKNLQ